MLGAPGSCSVPLCGRCGEPATKSWPRIAMDVRCSGAWAGARPLRETDRLDRDLERPARDAAAHDLAKARLQGQCSRSYPNKSAGVSTRALCSQPMLWFGFARITLLIRRDYEALMRVILRALQYNTQPLQVASAHPQTPTSLAGSSIREPRSIIRRLRNLRRARRRKDAVRLTRGMAPRPDETGPC